MQENVPLTRVVKLTIAPQHADTFIRIYTAHQQGIAQMKGCISVQAYRDQKAPHIFFTISQWENEDALDTYRYSAFFKSLWAQVKPLFTQKAQAHSLTPVV